MARIALGRVWAGVDTLAGHESQIRPSEPGLREDLPVTQLKRLNLDARKVSGHSLPNLLLGLGDAPNVAEKLSRV